MIYSIGSNLVVSTSISILILFGIIIPIQISAEPETELDVLFGTTPEIDGFIAGGEWDDANYIQYTIADDVDVTVYFKEDGQNLYVAFDIPTQEHTDDDSGIMIDVNNDGGTRPQRDDLVIQQRRDGSEKRESRGTGITWVSIPHTNWVEETSTSETGWQIEYSIEYSKLGITPGESKTIGVGFHILDDGMEFDWPVNPCYNIPDSWGDMSSSDNWYDEDAPFPPGNEPPEALATADKSLGYAPLKVYFTGEGSDSDGIVVSYHWDFDTGDESTERNPSYTFEEPGTYDVVLKVTDDDGATGTDTIEITVSEKPPDDGNEPPEPDGNDTDDDGDDQEDNSTPGFEAVSFLTAVIFILTIIRLRKQP